MKLGTFLTSLLICFGASTANAGYGVSYQGRLIDPNNHPVVETNVQFRVQIRSSGAENCLMLEETFARDLSQSEGIFSLTIGTGSRTDSSGYSIDKIFANRGTFTFAAGQCASGTTYGPSASDGRVVQVYFNDGVIPAGQWESMPAMAVNFAPMAIEAQQIGGYKKEQVIKIADGVNTSQTELNNASWTELLALIAGTSTKFMKSSDPVTSLYGATLPAPSNGQSIRWNSGLNSGSGGWENYTSSGSGTVTSVAAGAGLTGGPVTTTGTLSVDVGTTAGKIVQVAAGNKLPVIDGSNLTNLTAANVTGAVAIANGGTGQITKTAGFNALSPTTTKGDLVVSDGTNNVRLAAGTNGYVLKADSTQASGVKWASVTDTLSGLSCSTNDVPTWNGSAWACRATSASNINSAIMIRDSSGNFAANVGTVNGLKLDNGSGSQVTLQTPVAFTSYSLKMPTTTGTTGYVLTTDGGTPAQLSWSSPAGLSFWQDGGSGKIYYSGGNVGIGTSNPTSDLQVTGTNPVVNLQGSSATINTMTAGGAVYGGLKFNATGNSELNLFQSVSPSAGNSLVISDNGNYPTYPSYGFNIPAGGTRNIAFRDLGNGMSVAEIRVTSNGANTASNMLINTVGHANPSLFLDSAGNVGIGTATPAQTLDVNGTASVSASIESAAAYTNSGTAYTIADTSSNIRRITLTGNATITLPAFATPANKVWTLTVIVTQDGTGSRTLGWAVPGGDSILWDQSASAPAPASGVTKTTIYQFTKPSDTTVWYGSMVWKQN